MCQHVHISLSFYLILSLLLWISTVHYFRFIHEEQQRKMCKTVLLTLMITFLFILELIHCQIVSEFPLKDLEEWENFKKTYTKHYANETEDQQRMKIFLANKKYIEDHNKRYEREEVSFKMRLNQFSDLFPGEMKGGILRNSQQETDHHLTTLGNENAVSFLHDPIPSKIETKSTTYTAVVSEKPKIFKVEFLMFSDEEARVEIRRRNFPLNDAKIHFLSHGNDRNELWFGKSGVESSISIQDGYCGYNPRIWWIASFFGGCVILLSFIWVVKDFRKRSQRHHRFTLMEKNGIFNTGVTNPKLGSMLEV